LNDYVSKLMVILNLTTLRSKSLSDYVETYVIICYDAKNKFMFYPIGWVTEDGHYGWDYLL
jgi:hypothetical protein